MSNIFNLPELDNFSDQINLDELYEKKKIYDLNKLEIYNKLLSRIHKKIKITSRQHVSDQFCWFQVPEIMIGMPKYDHGACIAYLMDKLNNNGFAVRYIHPNVIFISWKHWIPEYVRSEIKQKLNINIDGHGNIVEKDSESKENPLLSISKHKRSNKPEKKFKAIEDYNPSGKLVYTKDFLKNIKK